LSRISFYSETPSFKLKGKKVLSDWLDKIALNRGGKIKSLQYVFCDDAYLLQINLEHLKHNTLTDIITFRYSEHPHPIESDIYISVERVKENAEKFKTTFENELHRVMVHGLLHLLGLKDKTSEEVAKMRAAEDESLILLFI
jgi:probable rRNA maturation factor